MEVLKNKFKLDERAAYKLSEAALLVMLGCMAHGFCMVLSLSVVLSV